MVELIARVVHAALREYNNFGSFADPLPEWDEAEQWMRESTIASVQATVANPNRSPEAEHQRWCDEKLASGWKWGPIKSEADKRHPCLVPYSELSPFQRKKDALAVAIVRALM